MLSGFPPLRGPAQMVAQLGPRTMVDFVRLLFMPAEGLGKELFQSAGARAWLYSSAMHGDVPPRSAGSAIAAAYLNIVGHAVGWPSPEGGAGRLADALVGRLRELGGEVRTGARVVAVRTAGRRATRRRGRRRRGASPRRSWWPTWCRARCWPWPATRCRPATPPGCAATATGRPR